MLFVSWTLCKICLFDFIWMEGLRDVHETFNKGTSYKSLGTSVISINYIYMICTSCCILSCIDVWGWHLLDAKTCNLYFICKNVVWLKISMHIDCLCPWKMSFQRNDINRRLVSNWIKKKKTGIVWTGFRCLQASVVGLCCTIINLCAV
jgi:hypothetical protein